MTNVLIVYVHPKAQCFNRAVLERTQAGLRKAGHDVQVADLYAEGFQPAMIEDDFAQFDRQPMPADVLAEQARVEWSDAIIFIFPLWWWSLPAMLKGWFDRVFTYGWAWLDPARPDLSALDPRKVLVLCSAGADKTALAKRGYDTAFETQLVKGTFSYCGFRDVTIRMLSDVHDGRPHADKTALLDEVEALAADF